MPPVCRIVLKTPVYTDSQMRGTEGKSDGLVFAISARSTVPMGFEYTIPPPEARITYSQSRSKLCHTGNTTTAFSPGFIIMRVRRSSSCAVKFLCISMTPLGSPVVPAVKIIVAISSSLPCASSCSTEPVCCARKVLPIAIISA